MRAEWSWYTVTLVIQLHAVNLPANLRTTTDAVKIQCPIGNGIHHFVEDEKESILLNCGFSQEIKMGSFHTISTCSPLISI